MIKFKSISEWKDYCFSTHKRYINNAYFENWIKEKSICIFNYSNLKNEYIKCIKSGIEKAIDLIGLHFRVKYPKYKFYDLSQSVEDGNIAGKGILKMVAAERKKRHNRYASIFIVDKPVKSQGAVLNYGEALTYVSEGITIFTFDPLKKYSSKFLRERAMHETFHLLGLNVHHGETKVQGYKQQIPCNMEYNAPSSLLCRKCKDALTSFWKGIEYATKKQFVKNTTH